MTRTAKAGQSVARSKTVARRTSAARPVGIALTVSIVALTLAACGSSSLPALPSLSNLTTGSLGAQPEPTIAAPKPITAQDRAVHVSVTAARAQKCGYNFDAARLRETFLAAETQRGTAAEDLGKAQQTYDFTYTKILGAIGGLDNYCTDKVTESTKRDLTAALAGSFDPPRSAVKDPDAVLAGYQRNYNKEEINPEWLRGDTTAPKTRPVEPQ
jgi:hypothetical protein